MKLNQDYAQQKINTRAPEIEHIKESRIQKKTIQFTAVLQNGIHKFHAINFAKILEIFIMNFSKVASIKELSKLKI